MFCDNDSIFTTRCVVYTIFSPCTKTSCFDSINRLTKKHKAKWRVKGCKKGFQSRTLESVDVDFMPVQWDGVGGFYDQFLRSYRCFELHTETLEQEMFAGINVIQNGIILKARGRQLESERERERKNFFFMNTRTEIQKKTQHERQRGRWRERYEKINRDKRTEGKGSHAKEPEIQCIQRVCFSFFSVYTELLSLLYILK